MGLVSVALGICQPVRHVAHRYGVGKALVRCRITQEAKRLSPASAKPPQVRILRLEGFFIRKGQVYDTAVVDKEAFQASYPSTTRAEAEASLAQWENSVRSKGLQPFFDMLSMPQIWRQEILHCIVSLSNHKRCPLRASLLHSQDRLDVPASYLLHLAGLEREGL